MEKPVTKTELLEILQANNLVLIKFIGERFDSRFNVIDQKFLELAEIMNEGFDTLHTRIDSLENTHERRITIQEDRTRILKNVLESELNTKVSW